MTYQEKHAANLKGAENLEDAELREIWRESLVDFYNDGRNGVDKAEIFKYGAKIAGDDRYCRFYLGTMVTAYRAGLEAREG